MILLDARMVGPTPHGIARYAEGLIPALRDAAPGEPISALVSPALPADSPLAAGSRTVTSIPLYGAREQILLPGLLRRLAPRLFHSLTYSVPLAAASPAIPTIHDLIHLRFATRLAPLQAAYYAVVVARAARRAPRVLTVSAATRDAIVERMRVPAERIVVTPLAAEARFHEVRAEDATAARLRHALPSEFLLYVGNRRPHKNAAGAVRIRGLLAQAHRLDIALVLVGVSQGDVDPREEHVAIRFLPLLPDADLPGLYRAARAVIVPSLDEGFGLPALEAMAAGTPVVAARRGGLPEVVDGAGILEDPDREEAFAEALARVLTDGGLAEELRARGRERAARFTWLETAQRTLGAYRDALAD